MKFRINFEIEHIDDISDLMIEIDSLIEAQDNDFNGRIKLISGNLEDPITLSRE